MKHSIAHLFIYLFDLISVPFRSPHCSAFTVGNAAAQSAASSGPRSHLSLLLPPLLAAPRCSSSITPLAVCLRLIPGAERRAALLFFNEVTAEAAAEAASSDAAGGVSGAVLRSGTSGNNVARC